jgi:hypothetical protein
MRLQARVCLVPVQVRTLTMQRDAAQDNIKTLATDLLKAKAFLDKLYKDGAPGLEPGLQAQGTPSTLQVAPLVTPVVGKLVDAQAVWEPTAERDASTTNKELASLLRKVAVSNEVAVAISNKNLAANEYMLHAWCGLVVCWSIPLLNTHCTTAYPSLLLVEEQTRCERRQAEWR